MKNLIKHLFLLLIAITNIHSNKLLLVDTEQGERYKYQPLISISESMGFDVEYLPISSVIDTDISKKKFDAAFFLLSFEFLKQPNSLMAREVIKVLSEFSKKPKKLIGLTFPPGIKQGIGPFNHILKQIGFIIQKEGLKILPNNPNIKSINQSKAKSIVNFLDASNKFLLSPLSHRGVNYDTTIFKAQKAKSSVEVSNINNISALPLGKNFKPQIKKLFPYGIHWHNPLRDNHVFITSQSFALFSSIAEDFRVTPARLDLRGEMIQAMHETLWQLFAKANLTTKSKPEIPKNLSSLGSYSQKKSKIKCPWMDISLFAENKPEKQDLLIDYIMAADFTHLWVSISPNWNYSPIALRRDGKLGIENTKIMIHNFTHKLEQKAAVLNKPIPKILIGFEIANNLRDKNIPYKNMAHDIYGNSYQDSPAPLSEKFWDSEIIVPLKAFLSDWKDNSNVPISGVMLDLEMYVKSSSNFLSTMGFDKPTFNKFAPNVDNQAKYLIENKKTQQYFNFLYQGAKHLGENLKTNFSSLIPNCIIGCYAPNISTHWFYKGFYRGLSSNNPMIFMSFNAEFNSHIKWLHSNKINMEHCSALMLDKINRISDFKKVNQILSHHDGVWFNRLSTLVENYVVYPEHTPLSKNPRAVKSLMTHISNANKP